MVVVLLLGAALRLLGLSEVPPGLSHDEAYNGITALEVWLQGRREIFFDIYNGIEPLIIYWQALYLRLFGITPFVMRLVNFSAGLLTIPLTYAVARRLLAEPGRWLALVAAVGVSLSFWAVFVSRLALRAVTLPLVELPAFYCLWRGLADDGAASRLTVARRLGYFAIGGAWLGGAMYTYLSSRFLPFVPLIFFGYLLVRRQVRREHWAGMALFFLTWALVFLPLALYYVQHPDIFGRRAGQVLNLPLALAGDARPLVTETLRTLGMFSMVGADTSRYGLVGKPVFEPLGALFFHIGLVVSLVGLRGSPRESASYAFLLIWWLVMLVPDFITGESPHFLRTVGALPPAYMLWALGIWGAGRWLVLRTSRAALRFALPALVLYLAVGGWLTGRDYFIRWAQDAEAREIYGADFTEVARYLEQTESGGPVALSAAYYRDWDRFRLDLQTHHDPPFVVWYDGRQTLLLPPPGSGLDPVYVFPQSAPPHARWLDFLDLEVQGSEMSVYRLKPDVQNGLALLFRPIPSGRAGDGASVSPGGLVRLSGYRIEGSNQAGGTLRVLLHWQPLQDVPGDPDYAFFAHLRDRREYTWAQVDANGYAVVDWQPGVQVLQWLELPLSPDLPPLSYALKVGLEDRSTGQPITPPVELETISLSAVTTPPSPEEFPVPNPTDITTGELFTLRGHWLEPRFLEPGASTHVTLFWQTQAAPAHDYTLVLWLVGQSGEDHVLGQRQPLEGDYATSRWTAGQWVRDRFDLSLPADLPGGLYQVYAGWRDPGGEFLATDKGPGIPLGEIFVAD